MPPRLGQLWEKLSDSMLISTGKILLIILVVLLGHVILNRIFAWLGRFMTHKMTRSNKQVVAGEIDKRVNTILGLSSTLAYLVLWAIGGVMILSEVGVNIGPIVTTAGVLGLAVSFGAQNFVRDLIGGVSLLIEDHIRVGDVAIINGVDGKVESINLRTTILRDLEGVVHVFHNGEIRSLANRSKEWSAVVFDIGVAYKEDLEQVMAVMKKTGTALRSDPDFGPLMLEGLEIFGVEQFADSAIIIKCRIKTQPARQWDVGREFRKRLKKAFDQSGIEIPYAHRSIDLTQK